MRFGDYGSNASASRGVPPRGDVPVCSACHGTGVAAGVPNGAFNGRFVIVVDTDVDITSLEDVVWAMVTRAPADEIDIVQGVYTSPLDPVVEDRSHATSDRVLIDATIPPDGDFPEVNRFDDAYREEITERWDLDEA